MIGKSNIPDDLGIYNTASGNNLLLGDSSSVNR